MLKFDKQHPLHPNDMLKYRRAVQINETLITTYSFFIKIELNVQNYQQKMTN